MSIVHGGCAIAGILLIASLFCKNKKKIVFKNILIMLAIQLVLTFVFLQTNVGLTILDGVSSFFGWLTAQGMAGVEFVFGGITLKSGATVFFLHVLCPLVFISALIGILNYLGILQFVVKWVGYIINKVTGMGDLESYVPIATTMLGSPQVFITIKEQIKQADYQQLFTICLTVISGMSASMLAAYVTMIEGKYVVVAVLLNMFSGLIISALMNPYEKKENNVVEETKEEKQPFFQMLGDYISSGFNLVVIVSAMVIGFISLITFLNNTFLAFTGMTFTKILGYVFSPIAVGIGVPMKDSLEIGSLMATKLLTNEFVAMGQVGGLTSVLSTKSIAMISVYLVSFVNFGTLGIISGTIKSIDESKAVDVAKFSIKLIVGGTLAGLLSATIVGIFF